MVANNMSQLNNMLTQRLRMAMSSASSEMLTAMNKETAAFYTKGKPRFYVRTGTLGDTPKVSELTTMDNIVSFEAYLDQTHGYTTGTFSANEVLTNAEAHTAGILGKPHFWANSEKKMDKILYRNMKRFFH